MLLLALAATTMSGCAPEPRPSPTPTPAFASEEEAFAAAEEVYRAYNEAGNTADNSAEFLTGSALETELETTRYLNENGLRLEGASVITSFTGMSAEVGTAIPLIEARVCLDVSGVKVIDSDGVDQTPVDRINVLTLDVTFTANGTGLLISDSETASESTC